MAVGLLVSGLIFTHALPRLADVKFWDEAGYLERGLRMAQDGWVLVQYAPLYSTYLWVLSWFVDDPVRIQVSSLAQVTWMLPILLFLLLRAARVSITVAWPLSAYFLVSYANLHLHMPVAHFGLIVILPFCIAALRAATPATGLRWLLGGTLLASYVRPEYFLPFVLFLPAWIFSEWRAARATTAEGGWRGTVALGAVFLLALFLTGAPAFVGGDGREMAAFAQHFARRWVVWTGSGLNPYFDFPLIIERVFGSADSPFAAMLANPSQFFRFIGENFVGLLTHGPRVYLLHFQLPPWAGGALTKPWDGFLLIGVLAGLSVVVARKHRAVAPTTNAWRLWLLTPLLIPGLLSALLVYPTAYYLLPVGIVGTAVALGFLHRRVTDISIRVIVLAAGIAAQLVLTPSLAQTEYAGRGRPAHDLVQSLRALNLRGPLRLLESEGVLNVFLGPDARSFPAYEKNEPFDQFMRKHDINVIVSSDYLEREDLRFKNDPTWRRFLQAPEAAGFSKVTLFNPPRRIYVRHDRLNRE